MHAHAGATFHFDPTPTPRFIAKYRQAEWGAAHMVFDTDAGDWIDGRFSVPVAAQAYADLLNAEDARPLPNEVKISADAADHTGRVLDALLNADTGLTLHAEAAKYFWQNPDRYLPAEADKYFWQNPDRYLIRAAADALLALGNDTDAIVTE